MVIKIVNTQQNMNVNFQIYLKITLDQRLGLFATHERRVKDEPSVRVFDFIRKDYLEPYDKLLILLRVCVIFVLTM